MPRTSLPFCKLNKSFLSMVKLYHAICYNAFMPIFYKVNAAEVECVEREAARYSGYRNGGDASSDSQIMELVRKSCQQLHSVLMPQAVYEEFDLKVEPVEGSEKFLVQFGGTSLVSRNLGINLKNCSRIIVLAGTVGARVDMAIRRSQTAGSADAAVMQGSGAMFVESFIDALNEKLKTEYEARGAKLHPRFSPGYGDVPLEFQKEIFRLLPCSKIGLSLMDSLIMAPEKSVTAFIGVE